MENMQSKLNELISILNQLISEDLKSSNLESLRTRQAMIKQSQELTLEFSRTLTKEFKRNNMARIQLLKKPGPSKLSNRQLSELVQEQAKLIAKLQSEEGDTSLKEVQ